MVIQIVLISNSNSIYMQKITFVKESVLSTLNPLRLPMSQEVYFLHFSLSICSVVLAVRCTISHSVRTCFFIGRYLLYMSSEIITYYCKSANRVCVLGLISDYFQDLQQNALTRSIN